MDAQQCGAHHLQRVLWAFGEARRRRLNPPAANGPTQWTADGLALDLSVAVRGGQAVLGVVGELGAGTAPRFLARVQALADEGTRSVIVDLGGASIGAGGLEALVAASALLERRNGELVLKSPRSHTLRLLDLAGLANSFVIC